MNEQSIPGAGDTIEMDSAVFTFAEIHDVVDRFYTRVQKDPLLSVPFNTVHDWPHHIERLTHFWWMRLGGRAYLKASYNPVEKHFMAGFNEVFLKRWLELFHLTLNEVLSPANAEAWHDLASRMGQALSMKNDYLLRIRSE